MDWRPLLDFVFPAQCASCNAIGSGLCNACRPDGKAVAVYLPSLRVAAVAAYEGSLRTAVLALKDGRRDVAEALGRITAPLVPAGATLVPVPTTVKRRRVRGLDGVALVARCAAAIAGARVVLALDQRSGDAQRGRSRAQRLAAQGRFACNRGRRCGPARDALRRCLHDWIDASRLCRRDSRSRRTRGRCDSGRGGEEPPPVEQFHRPLTPLDELYLQRAYELAARGIGSTSPNPPVGAVVVRDNRIVGEGYHHRAGDAHAEANALRQAARDARGATLYVSLEPCRHVGRTPPCTHAVIEAGIVRVVAGALDPTLHGGAAELRERGVDVAVAQDPVARDLIEPFARAGHAATPVRCAKNGDVARRGDCEPAGRRAAVDLARGAALRARSAHRARRRHGRRGHGARRRSATHGPPRASSPPSLRARRSLPNRGRQRAQPNLR